MSEYGELIKRFDKIRDYMRDFYVYGFMSREDFQRKSLRSYDDERRRIESYLGEYMAFRMEENGKRIFLAVNSADIPENPLYRAFKAKSFTKNDITLHFLVLDILRDGGALSAGDIADRIADYQDIFQEPFLPDLSTVRGKLAEYEALGLLHGEKQGRKLLYSLSPREADPAAFGDALLFFSEISPLGVVGSYLLDKCGIKNRWLGFKHHYIMHALESEVVLELLEAMHAGQTVEMTNAPSRSREIRRLEAVPLKILISVQGGRRYAAVFEIRTRKITALRLDHIRSISRSVAAPDYPALRGRLEEMLRHTWGVSFGNGRKLHNLQMTLRITPEEEYVFQRLQREGRFGRLSRLDKDTCLYEIQVYDAREMLPWLRTFIGRILSLECDVPEIVQTFRRDMEEMYAMYGGDEDAV